MELRLELFVRDIDKARRFYSEILGFRIDSTESGGYTRLSLGGAAIALNPLDRIPNSHPSKPGRGDKTGQGYEINLVVDRISERYAIVLANGGDVIEPLRERPWGSQDFCLLDPDGNYIRITT